jgi:hypothetical protein
VIGTHVLGAAAPEAIPIREVDTAEPGSPWGEVGGEYVGALDAFSKQMVGVGGLLLSQPAENALVGQDIKGVFYLGEVRRTWKRTTR